MRSTVVLALTAATAAYAQQVPKYDSPLNMTIVPDSVEPTLRANWCRGQKSTCNNLCADSTNDNDCDYAKLTYECTCASNSSAPGLEFYKETLPYFICAELFSQCIDSHKDDAIGQDACISNIEDKCPKNDPPKEPLEGADSDGASTSSSASRPTGTPAPNNNEGGDDSNTEGSVSTTSSDGLAAPTLVPAANGVAAIAAFGVLAYLV